MTAEAFASALTDHAEFRDITLADAEITGHTAYNLHVQKCRFIRCRFTDNCWEGLQAVDSTFQECDFAYSNLEDAVFLRCTFFSPDAGEGCTFLNARLRSARFSACRLSSAVFEGADLLWSTIEDSEAVGAKFFKAAIDGAMTCTRNLFKYADFRGADFSKCDVSRNSFVWATLDEANFEQANLVGSDLSGASLRFTKFAQADLRGALLGDLDLRTTDLEGVKIYEHQMRGLLETCKLIIYPNQR